MRSRGGDGNPGDSAVGIATAVPAAVQSRGCDGGAGGKRNVGDHTIELERISHL